VPASAFVLGASELEGALDDEGGFLRACSPGRGRSSMMASKIASMSLVRGISLLAPSVDVPEVGIVRNETRPASMPCIDSARLISDWVSTPST
jgi:hypothetical protein